jgi:hypothetical protein
MVGGDHEGQRPVRPGPRAGEDGGHGLVQLDGLVVHRRGAVEVAGVVDAGRLDHQDESLRVGFQHVERGADHRGQVRRVAPTVHPVGQLVVREQPHQRPAGGVDRGQLGGRPDGGDALLDPIRHHRRAAAQQDVGQAGRDLRRDGLGRVPVRLVDEERGRCRAGDGVRGDHAGREAAGRRHVQQGPDREAVRTSPM